MTSTHKPRYVANVTNRAFGYEFFKITHFASVIVFMLTFFWHCDYTLTSWHYFIATAAIYVPCFVYPWLRTVFEYKWTKQARVTVESNGFTRVTIPVNFHWTPGQHCFLRFTSFGILHAISSHPFTIGSSPSRTKNGQSELVFFIRHQDGFTKKLYQYALENPDALVPILIDGPYGGAKISRIRGADRQLLIAGGSGAGWCLPFIDEFMESGFSQGDEEKAYGDGFLNKETSSVDHKASAGTRSRPKFLRIVFATRDVSSEIWFEHAVQEVLKRYPQGNQSSSFQLQIYLTGTTANEAAHPSKNQESSSTQGSGTGEDDITRSEKEPKEVNSRRVHDGRPDLPLIIRDEADKAAEGHEALAVYVCGPSTMQNDVRNAVADANLKIFKGARSGGVYLHSEHFSWA